MKTKLLFVLATITALIAVGIGSVTASAFPDTSGHSYDSAIDYVKTQGIVNGYDDGTYKPDNLINRAEFTKIIIESLYETSDFESYGSKYCFSDVPRDAWYTQYVCFAKEKGIVDGHPDGSFKPTDSINYVESLKIVLEAYVANGWIEARSIEGNGFWYTGYTDYANSYDLSFAHSVGVDENLTRAETAETIYWTDITTERTFAPELAEDDIIYSVVSDIPTDDVIGDYKDEIVAAHYDGTSSWETLSELFEWYHVGEITVAPYDGWSLILLDSSCDGMCFYPFIYRFAWNEDTGELVLLTQHSEEYIPEFVEPFTGNTDDSIFLDGLELPETITMPDGVSVITRAKKDAEYSNEFADGYTETLAFVSSEVGNVYAAPGDKSCFFVKAKDGSITRYDYDPGFKISVEGEKMINWEDGSPDTNIATDYTYTTVGCGIMGSCTYIEDVNEENMELVGTTESGVALYIPISVDAGAEDLQATFERAYAAYYDDFDVPMDDFADMNFVLYWQDPLGRWGSVHHVEVIPPAECGKPVIYLYPPTVTDVHVEVDVDEFTVTIPDYGTDGWSVRAYPDGSIYNYADGEDYPYLFWEGHDKDKVEVSKGFMVSREELPSFLPESLEKMGLNDQEIVDFMEFWEPRMLDNSESHFFISFLGTHEFNKVAPLTITPEPDSLLRVFMYYEPTNAHYSVQEQELRAGPRYGFSVVEWGGTSSIPWKN